MKQLLKRESITPGKSKIITATFKEVVGLELLTPLLQGDLQTDKIKEMIDSYLSYPHHFAAASLIIIAELHGLDSKEYYLMDGQHRMQMCRELVKLGHNGDIILGVVPIYSEKEFKSLFEGINKDSFKCIYPRLSIFDKENYEIIKKAIILKYDYSPKSASEKNRLYGITEFVNKLFQGLILITADELFIKEAEFYDKAGYKELFHQNKTLFSLTEKRCISAGHCSLMKRNNFIEWIGDDSIIPKHSFISRKAISAELRKSVWNKYFPGEIIGKCLHSECKNVLKIENSYSWHVGHIISVHNGGTNCETNLKPICPDCNYKMSYKNWAEDAM